MNKMVASDMMLVPLRQNTLEVLLGLKGDSDRSVDDVISRLARLQVNANTSNAAPEVSHDHPDIHEPYAFSLLGERQGAHTARGLLVAVLRTLHELDPRLLPELSRYHARKRRYIARSPDRLYPGRPDLARHSAEVADGWWVGTNHSKRDVERILRVACNVAGLDYTVDLIVQM